MARHAAPRDASGEQGTVQAHQQFGEALSLLLGELSPWVDEQLTAVFPGKDWKAALGARDAAKTGYAIPVDLADPRRVMRLLRDDYRAFTPRLTRTQTAYAHLVLDLTNTWAHSTSMDAYLARRGIDYMVDLLLSLSRHEAAERVLALADGLEPARAELPHKPALVPVGVRKEDPASARARSLQAEAVVRDVQSGGVSPGANDSTEYVPAVTTARHAQWHLDQLKDPASCAIVRGEVRDVIAAEAPILLDRLLSVVGWRFGFEKVHDKRRDSIAPFVPPHLIRFSANRERVVWPEGEGPEGYTSYRIPAPGTRRPVGDVPYEELRNAMVEICWDRPEGIARDALCCAANAQFGGQLVKGATRTRLHSVIDAAVNEGTLDQRDGAIVAVIPAPAPTRE